MVVDDQGTVHFDNEPSIESEVIPPHLLGMQEVVPRLWIGDYTSPSKVDNKFHLVINCTTERIPVAVSGIVYYQMDTLDGEAFKPKSVEMALKLIKTFVMSGHVLIHCIGGISRSASMMTAALHYCYGLPFQEAFREIRSVRPIVKPLDKTVASAVQVAYRLREEQ